MTIEHFLKAVIAFLEQPKEQEWEDERFQLLEYVRELLPTDNQPHHACTTCGSIFVVDGDQCRSCADGL